MVSTNVPINLYQFLTILAIILIVIIINKYWKPNKKSKRTDTSSKENFSSNRDDSEE